jgi:transposase
MNDILRVGLDLGKNAFEVHAVDSREQPIVRRTLRRSNVLAWFAKLPPCLVGIEACGTAYHWAREIAALGHTVRLIPPAYAKAYVRRNKNDAADAAAICEAVSRPSMRFVPIKTAEQQAEATLHKTREMLIKQRTMSANALRAHMAEFGIAVPQGAQHLGTLYAVLDDPTDTRVPALAKIALKGLAEMLASLSTQIEAADKQILRLARDNPAAKRLGAVPGFGPVLASAVVALMPEPAHFRCGRDFAAALGLVPRQDGTGGKTVLGGISKRGNRYLRRLLVNGAMAVLGGKRAKDDPWLSKLLESKPRMLVAVALANKMARIAWAMLARGEEYRPRAGEPMAAAA